MGTDIHLHIEHQRRKKGKKPHWIHPGDDETNGDRIYGMFGIMAGVRTDIKPLYPPRGLPGDVTDMTYKEYKMWGGDAHTASWLTTEEFCECLEELKKIFREEDPDVNVDVILNDYHQIYRSMKEYEDDGEPARIVFWFDN